MARTLRWTLFMALFALPLAAGAQQVGGSVSTTSTVGPRAEGTRIGVTVQGSIGGENEREPTLQSPNLRRRGVPLMIIGGAALVGGAIIGDDAGTLIMIGGLAVGLYGLYQYLQ